MVLWDLHFLVADRIRCMEGTVPKSVAPSAGHSSGSLFFGTGYTTTEHSRQRIELAGRSQFYPY